MTYRGDKEKKDKNANKKDGEQEKQQGHRRSDGAAAEVLAEKGSAEASAKPKNPKKKAPWVAESDEDRKRRLKIGIRALAAFLGKGERKKEGYWITSIPFDLTEFIQDELTDLTEFTDFWTLRGPNKIKTTRWITDLNEASDKPRFQIDQVGE